MTLYNARAGRWNLTAKSLAAIPALTLACLVGLGPAIKGQIAAPSASPPDTAQGIWTFDSSWQDDRSNGVRFAEFSGRPAFVSMIYTSCANACPLILQRMRKVVEAGSAKGVTADIVLISLDPAHDSPTKLASYKAHLKEAATWRLLVGDASATRAVANLLGVRYGTDPKTGEITHDSKIFYVNGKGEVVATLDGLEDDMPSFLAKIAPPKSGTGG